MRPGCPTGEPADSPRPHVVQGAGMAEVEDGSPISIVVPHDGRREATQRFQGSARRPSVPLPSV